MAALPLTTILRGEYERLFQSCRVRPDAMEEVTTWAERIAASREAVSRDRRAPRRALAHSGNHPLSGVCPGLHQAPPQRRPAHR